MSTPLGLQREDFYLFKEKPFPFNNILCNGMTASVLRVIIFKHLAMNTVEADMKPVIQWNFKREGGNNIFLFTPLHNLQI